ncbi:ABC transporter, ATPbinding domain containing protein [Acanthamoeba castellanii str. Neff]|uniref:ABC transporter, ATPbinding domain containing protein n=1 Tax=Acanthamoeba castellanii (strain ATCC 30010 / Neff) TaxID=1257118 RepID=L8H7I0_ACACF|nr:ABC transporter, ATPbinding domain containing protein [Acanthamoeba castellanii str. Neff]ELR21489.1 ABC transporter, ATPbinding domain containing protein [Acanthamoeba castellanii str. Neff]
MLSDTSSSSSSGSLAEDVGDALTADHGPYTARPSTDLFDDEEELANEFGASIFARIDQDTPFSCRPPKNRLNLEWRDINYKITYAQPAFENRFFQTALKFLPLPPALLTRLGLYKTGEIPILNNVSGSVGAGELVAIMGPTGSGKTTLLNVLSKRITHGGANHLTGQVLINGNDKITAARLKRRMAYVLQEDIFFPEISVRETVRTAAMLKLPRKMSAADKKAAVEDVLNELGISRCANTIVGDGWTRGVSGGERKRTNIATEIVGNRPLVFLDEPTTGLDAATSLGLVVSMRALAQSGHTVVSTIHQPSSAMFLMFDRVILLAEGGWTVYSGPTKDVLSYFASLGLHAPIGYNAADFMLEVVSCHKPSKDGRTVRQLLIDSYAAQEQKQEQPAEKEMQEEEDQSELERTVQDLRKGKKYTTPFWLQLWILAQRTFKQRRAEILCWRQVVLVVALAVLSGLLWLRLGKDVPAERAVLNKERDTGTYRLSAYYLAKVLAEVPLMLVLPFVYAVITYWMVGLTEHAGAFFLYVLTICMLAVFSSVMGLLIGTTIPDMSKAMVLSVIILLVTILLGGFFISRRTLRDWIFWARWTSFMKYTYELALLNEYHIGHDTFTPSTVNSQYATDLTGGVITGEAVLDHANVETKIWADFLFLAGSIVLAHTLAYLSLRFLNKKKI